jgi:hypothetical protein
MPTLFPHRPQQKSQSPFRGDRQMITTFVFLFAAICGMQAQAMAPVSVTGPSRVRLGGYAQYGAYLGGAATPVVWSVNGFPGGTNSTGPISTSGLYAPASTFWAGHSVTITATTTSEPVSSTSIGVKVLNPLPVLASGLVTQVSGNSFSLVVQGSGFVSTSQLLSAAVDVATIFISSTQLQGSISISPGTTNIKVGVLNPNAAQSVPASMTLPIQRGTPTSPLQPPQCVAAMITQPAPIALTPITRVLPTATTINVLLNGAVGDGLTNDSPALQSTIDNNPNAVIYFPLGNYVLDNPSANQSGLLFFGFHGTAIMANGARFLCDTATASAGQCIKIDRSSGASFDNFRVGYTQEQNLPLSRTSAISNGILVQNSSTLNFGNTTVEASTGSGIWVTDSTGISFLGGTSVSKTTADGLHFENVGNATVVGYTGRNTGDDSLAATNITTSNPNCGLNASNIQIYQSHSRGIVSAGACGSSFSNFYIENTSNSGLGVVQDQTINSRIPVNNTFSNGTVVNAGRYPGIPGSKDCIDIAESSATTVSNVECSTPMIDGLFVFGGADQVTVSGVTVDGAANVGFQAVESTNVSLSNTINRNSVYSGYAIQSLQGGSMVGVATCSSGVYGFYHSAAINFTESNLMSYDSAENSSMHRVWWAENSSQAVSVNGFSILDDQTHTAPDVVGGFGDASGSIMVDGITQNLLDTTLSVQLP